MRVPILKQGSFLIATVQAVPTDSDLAQMREELLGQLVRFRSQGVLVDVTAVDVLDSYACRMLRETALMIRLRGARTVLVGIQPEVAISMVQMGLSLEGVATALDLEEGLIRLSEASAGSQRV